MNRSIIIVFLLALSACSSEPPVPMRPAMDEAMYRRGETLVKGLAACGFCHGQTPSPDSPLSGGRVIEDRYGEVHAPNLTHASSGIGKWSVEELIDAIRNSRGREDEELSQEVHRGFLWMSDEDLLSIIAYLRSAPPIENEVERRQVGFVSRNTKGFWKSRKDVRGSVPPIRPVEKEAYGEYLVDNIAQCGLCHNSPETTFGDGEYLGGGRTITQGEESRIASPLRGTTTGSFGKWSAADIVAYLRTGTTPDKRVSDPRFCPYKFYANAPQTELEAVAAYLKTLPAL